MEYKLEDSVARINELLSAGDNSYEEQDSIPTRDRLTFANGFYVRCAAMFVDIRKSSELIDFHKNRALAKLYRAYTSEAVAVMNGNPNSAEINVVGDCVSGIFNTPEKKDIDSVFGTAYTISSLIDILNFRLKKHNMTEIVVGIGLAWGRVLMVKAGFSGSGINDIVWVGEAVNEASKLASYGNREYYDREIMVSDGFHYNLNDQNKGLLVRNDIRNCYNGNVVSTYMNNWYQQNCV